TAVANLAAEGITDGVHLVGDVMVDVARTFEPAARRTGAVERLGLEPGGYALVTVHRQSNTSAEAMPALVEVLETIAAPAVFPIHPRTRAALEAAGLRARAEAAAPSCASRPTRAGSRRSGGVRATSRTCQAPTSSASSRPGGSRRPATSRWSQTRTPS